MDINHLQKEIARINYFSNTYLIIASLLLQVPLLFNWITVSNVENLIALNTLTFIVSGIFVSLHSSSHIRTKIEDEKNKIIDKITILKAHEKVKKAFEYITIANNEDTFKYELNNIKAVLHGCYHRTNHEYLSKSLKMCKQHKLISKEMIPLFIFTFLVMSLSTFYQQLNLGLYELIIIVFTMILGVVYGYKAGTKLVVMHDVYPIKLINMQLDKFMNENKIEMNSFDWNDKKKVADYDYENDKII